MVRELEQGQFRMWSVKEKETSSEKGKSRNIDDTNILHVAMRGIKASDCRCPDNMPNDAIIHLRPILLHCNKECLKVLDHILSVLNIIFCDH